LPFWSMQAQMDDHHLYRLREDPTEEENRTGEPLEDDMIGLLREALKEVEAPDEQFERLGIS